MFLFYLREEREFIESELVKDTASTDVNEQSKNNLWIEIYCKDVFVLLFREQKRIIFIPLNF